MPELALHPILQYSHCNLTEGLCCPLIWDLREPPTTARHISSPTVPISSFELTQHATAPPIQHLSIICTLLPEPWPIQANNPYGVTVQDVLQAIFTVVSTQLTHPEWDRLCQKQRDRMEKVFETRCRVSPNSMAVWEHGVIRVDCLLQHTLFGGFSVLPADGRQNQDSSANTYILSLRRPK